VRSSRSGAPRPGTGDAERALILDGRLTAGSRPDPNFGPAEVTNMDIVYVAGVLGFLALSWGLVRLCEKVG
jgi:hypothetical protein